MRDWICKSAYSGRLTHLLLVILCTMGSTQKSVMSLTSCRLWDKTADHKGSISHKLLSWDIYQIYASSMMLTHCHQYHHIMPLRIWWQLTCVWLFCPLATWSMTKFVFMWRHCSVTYKLMIFFQYLSFHMKVTYLPVHLLSCKSFCADVQFDKNALPRNVEILKKLWEWLHPMSTNFHISEHV